MKAFNGDTFILDEFKKLIKDYGIKTVIETGTFAGDTTLALSDIVESVLTVELSDTYFSQNKEKFTSHKNITAIEGNSVDILSGIDPEDALCFLDAHWNEYNPLLDELKAISGWQQQPIIVIHDFKVPDHPELGFDSYAGQDYDFAWIEKVLDEVYPEGYAYYYNSQATGSMRGAIFIIPNRLLIGSQ